MDTGSWDNRTFSNPSFGQYLVSKSTLDLPTPLSSVLCKLLGKGWHLMTMNIFFFLPLTPLRLLLPKTFYAFSSRHRKVGTPSALLKLLLMERCRKKSSKACHYSKPNTN